MFSLRLKELRNSKNLTQKELANVIGVSYQTIAKYEIGDRHPRYDVLKSISDYFGVSIDFLLGGTDFQDGEVRYIDEAVGKVSPKDALKNLIDQLTPKQIEALREQVDFMIYQNEK